MFWLKSKKLGVSNNSSTEADRIDLVCGPQLRGDAPVETKELPIYERP